MKKLILILVLMFCLIFSGAALGFEKVDVTGFGFDTAEDFRDKIVEFLEALNEDPTVLDWENVTVTNATYVAPDGLTIGENGTGFDVQFFGDTPGCYWLWDEDIDTMVIVGDVDITGAVDIIGDIEINCTTVFVPDATRTDYAYAIGTRVTELDVTMAGVADQNLDPIQANLNVIGIAPTGTSTMNLSYALITHDTVSMPNLRIKVTDWTVDIGEAVQDAYVLQTELIVRGTKVSSGELIAVSALTTLGTGARTADRVCALQAMITGAGTAGTVVGDAIVAYIVNAGTVITTDDIVKVYNQSAATVVDGIEIENDGTMTTAFKLNNDGTCGTGILFEGAFDHGIRFSEDPIAGDVTNSFINVGDYTTALAVAPTTANMFGVVHNVSLTDINVAYWYQAYYTKITTSGTTTSTSIAGHALRMNVATNLEAVYGIQCHTNITAGADVTQEVISVSSMVDMGTGDTTTDRVVALQAMITGSGTAGTVTGLLQVASFVNAGTVVDTDAIIFVSNQSAATSAVAIELDLDGTVTNVFEFNGTVCDAWAITDSGVAAISAENEWFLIPVTVEGSAIQFYIIAAETWN